MPAGESVREPESAWIGWPKPENVEKAASNKEILNDGCGEIMVNIFINYKIHCGKSGTHTLPYVLEKHKTEFLPHN